MSLVAIGLMYSLILSPGFGAFDELLKALGLGAYIRTCSATTTSRSMSSSSSAAGLYRRAADAVFTPGSARSIPNSSMPRGSTAPSPDRSCAYVNHTGIAAGGARRHMLSVIQSLRTFDVVSVMTSGGRRAEARCSATS